MSHRASHPVYQKRIAYTTTNVGVGAYVQIEADLPTDLGRLEFYDDSGVPIKLAVGPAGSEHDIIMIFPNANFQFHDIILNKHMQLSLKSLNGTATTGQLLINGYV